MIDLIIVLSYFFLIFFIAVSKGYNKNLSADEYFLSSRKLKWPSIALSTIATNVNGYQFANNIKANSPIKWNLLSKVTLVKKGQIVDVFASGNGIYVTMKGMALENGVAGGDVTVKNLSSKKEFQAKVLNENSVKVHL